MAIDGNRPPAIQVIGIASVFYGISDPLLTVYAALGSLQDGPHRTLFEHLGRVPVVIMLLAGGLGVLRGRTWSRFVYWLLPIYSMIVTLVLMPAVFRSLPVGGDVWGALDATALYWPIVTAVLYPVAFIVSNYFWNLEQSNFPRRAGGTPERAKGSR